MSFIRFLVIIIKVIEVVLKFAFKKVFIKSLNRLINIEFQI